MIDVVIQRFTLLDSYAQGPQGAGSWMELVDRHLPDPLTPPGPLSATLPPFGDYGDSWGRDNNDHNANPYEFALDDDDDNFDVELGDGEADICDCGGPPPPPFFNLPPPPRPPAPQEPLSQSPPLEDPGEIYHNAGSQGPYTHLPKPEQLTPTFGIQVEKMVLEGANEMVEDCEEASPTPQDACPALLIAGDAHVRPRLQPPVAALLVAAVTFAFVLGIAAVVCWRFRKQRNRPGSTKSTSDLTNGVIYDDLPSGPTPRGLTTHGHDTCTLAPMELLDLKMASQLNAASYVNQDRSPHNALQPSNANAPPGGIAFPDAQTATNGSFQYYPDPYNLLKNSNNKHSLQLKDYLYRSSQGSCPPLKEPPPILRPHLRDAGGFLIYSQQNSCTNTSPPEVITYSPANFEDYRDFLRADYSESVGPKRTSSLGGAKGSQELYNPTYEEISTGSESASISSRSSSKKHGFASSPQGLMSPSKEANPGSWSQTPCPCTVKGSRGSSSPKSTSHRSRRQKQFPNNPSNPFTSEDYHEEYEIPPPIPPPALYTIPGTSDGRTSTSSSSDQPLPERMRETRYYVGGQRPPTVRTPETPPERYVSPYSSSVVQEKLPPLPSRSDRYRIFFTTDRKRGLKTPSQSDFKTLDLASRKRNRSSDFCLSNETEPLYHEL